MYFSFYILLLTQIENPFRNFKNFTIITHCPRQMSLKIPGTIGAKPVSAHLEGNRLTLTHKNKILFQGSVWVICFQRVSKKLKTCDVVYIDGRKCYVQTIERSQVETIQDSAQCPVYHVGLDPLPWKSFCSSAATYKWQVADWQHLFEAETESDSSDDDDEWVPDAEVESDDEMSD